ncbi:MAG: transcription termination factor NusA [Candidatus Omnitrophota bacterium]
MNGALLAALERIEREKGIDKEVLYSAIESALVSAARKVIDDPEVSKEDIIVEINRETGAIEIFAEDEKIENDRFGRIAAQTAKQVIVQKIREAEREVVFDKYTKKIGTIISGSVHRFEKGNVIVELDDTEAVLPKTEQIPQERFRQGENIRAYLLEVERGSSNPSIVLSRAAAGFVKKLFELEVPEISQGIVEIKALAREAGERTKIAVCSKEDRIDPVGACVGMRGSRVRDIVKELHGERIDIVRWNEDIREYLPASVSPAEISKMAIDRSNKRIVVTVPKDQLSLLIGKKGRNIRLASKLLGWTLVAEVEEDEASNIPLAEIKRISEKKREALEAAGYETAQKVKKADPEELANIEGIGVKTAEKLIEVCKEAVETKLKEERLVEKEAQEKIKREEAEKRVFETEQEPAEEKEGNAEEGSVEDKEDEAEETAIEGTEEGSAAEEEVTTEDGTPEEESDK